MKTNKILILSTSVAVTLFMLLIGFIMVGASSSTGGGKNISLAEMYKDEPLKIDYIFAFATPESAKNGAVFLTVYNQADTQDFLIRAETKVAKHTELHETYIDPDDQTMMMRKVDKIEIPEGYDQILVPNGHHIMLIGLYRPLKKGDQFDVTLHFEKAGALTQKVLVTAPGEILQPDEDTGDGEDFHGHDHNHETSEPAPDVAPIFLKQP